MQGLPKILQTRDDFDLVLHLARNGEASPAILAHHYIGLVESAHSFVFHRELAVAEAPDGVLPEYCVIEASEQDPIRRQLKRTVDSGARLFQLGYTVAEIQTIITELEAING